MSLREFVNRSQSLRSVKRLITPLWTLLNGRSGQDAWLALLKANAAPVELIVDVGSSDGHFFRKAFTHFPRANYHHFEPRPDAAQRLRGLIAQLRARSTVHEVALAERSGRTEFAVMDYGDASSLLVSTRGVGTRITQKIEVKVETLDSFDAVIAGGDIGLLKIDVEGVERRVLEGAHDVLARRARTVILEISALRHEGGNAETLQVFALMFDAGFRLVDTTNSDYLFTKDPGVLAAYKG